MAYYLAEEREVQINFDPTVGEWAAWTNIFYWKERFLKNGWTLTKAEKLTEKKWIGHLKQIGLMR